jgi:hypothetical protein
MPTGSVNEGRSATDDMEWIAEFTAELASLFDRAVGAEQLLAQRIELLHTMESTHAALAAFERSMPGLTDSDKYRKFRILLFASHIYRGGSGICVRPHRYALGPDELGLHECDMPLCVKVCGMDRPRQHASVRSAVNRGWRSATPPVAAAEIPSLARPYTNRPFGVCCRGSVRSQ